MGGPIPGRRAWEVLIETFYREFGLPYYLTPGDARARNRHNITGTHHPRNYGCLQRQASRAPCPHDCTYNAEAGDRRRYDKPIIWTRYIFKDHYELIKKGRFNSIPLA